MKKYHYVYRSFEVGGREYIGIRTCNCLPEEDTTYFGSFKDKTFKPTEKTILFVCKTRQEVAEIEIELHDFFDVAVNPQFANRSKQTSTKFDRTGVSPSEETRKKLSKSKSRENHPLFGTHRTEPQRQAHSKRMTGEKHPQFGKTGVLHHNSKAVTAIKPDNTKLYFDSGMDVVRELGFSSSSLSTCIKANKPVKKGRFKGWVFYYSDSG